MTAVATATNVGDTVSPSRFRPHEIWRIVRLLAVNPTVFFGVPWIILGGAWAVTLVIALIIQGAAGAPLSEIQTGFRYSWAVLSPQWYLVVVGVQAVAYTFSFALGFGATRRDYWLGMSVMFLLVSIEMAAAIATLVQLEKITNGWWIGAGMFDALWYGQQGWIVDFYTTFAFQMMVLFIGAGVTATYMRWRVRGTLALFASVIVLVLVLIAALTFTESWIAAFTWFAEIGVVGVFTIILALALLSGIGGYLVIRRATPR